MDKANRSQARKFYKMYVKFYPQYLIDPGRNRAFKSKKKETLYFWANFLPKFSAHQISQFLRNAVGVH